MSTPVSTWLDVQPDHVPERLRRVPKWLGWRAEERVDKRTGEMKLTKAPYRIAEPSEKADVTKPETWGSFEDAVEAYGAGVFDGTGYVFTVDDPVMGVDLDKCRDPETGAIAPWAAAIIARLRTYTEISPSGRGLRVFLIGFKPGDRCRTGSIEMYDNSRFFSVTGHHLVGTPTTIEMRQAELDALYAETFPAPATTNGQPPRESRALNLDDEELLRRAYGARNGAAFERLWSGDASAHTSHSEADLALCAHLAFWTGRDAARMDRLFRRSGLMREKWDERHGAQTYGVRTIATAIAGCRDVYAGGAPGHRDRQDDRDRDRADDHADRRDRPSPGTAPGAIRTLTVTADDLPLLLDPTDHSMALIFERFYAGDLHSSPQYGVKTWSGLIWEDDSVHGRHRIAAVETVQTLMATADTIPIPAGMLASVRERQPTMTVEDVEASLRQTMRSKLKKWENAGRLNAMIEMASLRPPFLADVAQFDRDPWALTVANGVLDLRKGTLMAATPERMLTKASPVAYDPAAACPRFERFLVEIFPQDTADVVVFMQRLIGMTLTGVVRDHILPIWWGVGRNGKTTLLSVVQKLLGPAFAQVAPLSLLLDTGRGTQIPNDRARLHGARLVATSETPERGKLAEDAVKALTGGNRLTGRFLNHEFFDFDPTHKLILETNHRPIVQGQDNAIWSRIALVPFVVRFWKLEDSPPPGAPLQDPNLIDALLVELPGILNWALAGCLAWQRDGNPLPKIVRVATAQYRLDEDVLRPFLDECCEVDASAWVAFEDLYVRYEQWTASGHGRAMTKQALGRVLTDRGFESAKEGGTRGRNGLRLRVGAGA